MNTDPQTDLFVPPAAEGLPLAALDSATEGADRLDASARTPYGRNLLAHALVQLARDGWLRTEPGEGFEPVRDREATDDPEPTAAPAVSSPPPDRAAVLAGFVLWLDAPDGSVPTHDGIQWPDGWATIRHRHYGHTTTHHTPEAAAHAAHGTQGRIVWAADDPSRMAVEAQQQPDTETPYPHTMLGAAELEERPDLNVSRLPADAWTSDAECICTEDACPPHCPCHADEVRP